MNHKHKTIVISFDGLGTADWKTIERLPAFARFLKEAAYCKQVETVYPSLTYPAHCSIATGRWPVNHRVVHNTLLQPQRMASPDWYWKRRYIQGKTIYEVAKEKGLKTAAFLWPVTAGAAIDYNIPEIFANRKWDHQIFASLRSGSKKLQVEVFARYGKLMRGIEQPYLDNFLHESVKYTLEKYEPDLSLIHYVDLDGTRHRYGHDSSQALMALNRHDKRLAELMELMEGEPVTWVLLGDHSSLDETKAIRVNRILQRKGWLETKGDGESILRYQALMQEGDGSAYVYAYPQMTEEDRAALAREVQAELEIFSQEHDDCIEAIYTGEEAAEQGADGNCLLMLEAKQGYYFQDTLQEPDICEYETKATHGYSPKKPGYTTVFAMKGPGIRQGEVIDTMRLIDEGPIIAHVLGGELPEADGKLRKEFFDESRKDT